MKEFYFDSRDLQVDDPRFIAHCEMLDNNSKQQFEVRKAHPWFRKNYIVTLGYKCIITKVKFPS